MMNLELYLWIVAWVNAQNVTKNVTNENRIYEFEASLNSVVEQYELTEALL